MANEFGTEKGIPFNKWKDEEVVQKNKDFLKRAFDKMISEPSKNEKYKKFIKNIRRVGLK